MLEFRAKSVREVSGCTCDRCGRRMTPDAPDLEWYERVSIAYHGGFASLFGDGHAISVDLCQYCVRDTLGAWLRIASSSIYDLEPLSAPIPLSSLRGIVRHDADDAVSIEAMNDAVVVGATSAGTDDPSSDPVEPSGELKSYGEYRVIEYEVAGEIWRELREVDCVSGHAIGKSSTAACVRWRVVEGDQSGEAILERMRAALIAPVLRGRDSESEGDLRQLAPQRPVDHGSSEPGADSVPRRCDPGDTLSAT